MPTAARAQGLRALPRAQRVQNAQRDVVRVQMLLLHERQIAARRAATGEPGIAPGGIGLVLGVTFMVAFGLAFGGAKGIVGLVVGVVCSI